MAGVVRYLPRRVKACISLAVVLGLLTGAVFLYRRHKKHAITAVVMEACVRLRRVVLAPNHLEVTGASAGGPNWWGLGRFDGVLGTKTPSGLKIVLFFEMDSSITGVEVVEVLMAIRDSPLNLHNTSPEKLAEEFVEWFSTRGPGPMRLAEAESLTEEDWAALSRADPSGTLRILIPPERLKSETPLVLSDACPGLFERTDQGKPEPSSQPSRGRAVGQR